MRRNLSIIVPTIGRRSLKTTLDSIGRQLGEHDEVIVVGDGPQPAARKIVGMFSSRFVYEETPEAANDWGGTPRNHGIRKAKGTHLAFMDDDDIYLLGGIRAMHAGIEKEPAHPLLFRMEHADRVIWETKLVLRGNVSTQMLVLPNIQERIPEWGPAYSADFDFIARVTNAEEKGSSEAVWCDPIIARLMHHKRGK